MGFEYRMSYKDGYKRHIDLRAFILISELALIRIITIIAIVILTRSCTKYRPPI